MSIAEQLATIVRERAADIRDRAAEKMVVALGDAAPDGPPRDSGGIKLKNSMRWEPFESGDIFGATVEATADHAEFVTEGTPPHLIQGNPILAFEWRGAMRFYPYVSHPGTSPNPYFGDTTKRWGDMLQEAIAES